MLKLLISLLQKRQPEPLPADVAAINSALEKLREATGSNLSTGS